MGAYGGAYGCGAAFRVGKDGSGFILLRSFTCSTDGGLGGYCLIEGSDGALYGTTTSYGNAGAGTAFRISKDGSEFNVLKSFDDPLTDGANPNSMLFEDGDGVLYGTTYFGGTYGYGTVYRLNKDGSGFAVLKSFDLATDGGLVVADLCEGSDGALYGTARDGGGGRWWHGVPVEQGRKRL